MKHIRMIIQGSLIAAAAIPLAGCQTWEASPAPAPRANPDVHSARFREDLRLMDERVRRLEGQIESLEMEMNRLRQDVQSTAGTASASTRRRIASLESRIDQMEAARKRDREAIVKNVSREMETILEKQPQNGDGGTDGYGYEHEVQSGETLSAIAKAYGVTVKKIVEANNLRNPDRLQVGQKLFIPE